MTKASIELQDLRRRIYVKAKAEPSWRFWGLYVHVCKRETLCESYRLEKKYNGAPGIDGVTFDAIESRGVEVFLDELRTELISGQYRPMRNRKVEIPKEGGKVRVLGIPSIRDRVAQGCLKLILEPIFESDFQDGSYGYRTKRTAHQAVARVSEAVLMGLTRVVDLDLKSYFDTVSHSIILRKVAERVNDAKVMRLLKLILKASGKRGVPQGGVLSPLLANIYMRRFLKAWELRGNGRKLGSRIVAYADDFVILCRKQSREALAEAERILTRLGLTLHPAKTRICCVNDEPFDFLGYSFGVQYRFGSGHQYLAAYPSVASVRRLKAKLRRMVGNHMSWISEEKLIGEVNRVLRGWTNYFSYGTLWKTYGQLERFTQRRVRGWLVHKHRLGNRGERRFPASYIYEALRLMDPTRVLRQRARLQDEPDPRAGCGKTARPVR